jgi:hypothetical protein
VRRTGGRSRERGRDLGSWRPLEWVMALRQKEVVRQEETVLVSSIGREAASAGGSRGGGSGRRSWVGGVARGRSGHRQLPKLASDA